MIMLRRIAIKSFGGIVALAFAACVQQQIIDFLRSL